MTRETKAMINFKILTVTLIASFSILASSISQAQLAQPIIRYDTIHHAQKAYYGMVVSQQELASVVGRDILQAGGNAVDAAVAMGFALAVTLPRAGNIGGSGFMLVHIASENRTIALDYRSIGPPSVSDDENRTPSGEIDWDKLTFGPTAAAIPGTVAGLYEAWKRFGSRPWAELLQPAYELAYNGFPVSTDLNFALELAGQVLAVTPASAAIYIRPDGYAWQPGQLLIQKDLAWSIQQIQKGGADAFYKGEVAQKIIKAFQESGRQITPADLAAYRVRERDPVSTTYRGKQIVSMPPSSAGGITLIQMLNILQNFNVGKMGAGSAKHLHLLAEVMKRANANRRTYIGDPDFVDVPIDGFISPALGKDMAKKINMSKAAKVKHIDPEPVADYESRDTTHFSVMDAQGNAVSNTYTLGYSFGSGWVAEGTGILFDNQMRNFYISNYEDGLAGYAPGKRMLSTMTPTLVLDEEGQIFIVTGTPGGGRIINTILQLLVNVIDFDMNIAEATHRPRIQQGWNSQTLRLEDGFSPDTIEILEKMGHEVIFEETMGSTQSILFADKKFYGSADSRRPNATALGVIYPPELGLKKAASGN
jgi:gamma-glutamyltranspeptidase/glutathione hydrolase